MKKNFSLIIVLLLIFSICSCTEQNTTSNKIENSNSSANINNSKTSSTNDSNNTNNTEADSNDSPNSPTKKTVKLYFVGQGNDYKFISEDVELTITNGEIAKAIIEELLKEENRLKNGIPEGTKLLSTNLQDTTLTIDFSKEFKENINLGSGYETMMVYSIVNSLTEIPNIKKVQFKIEGKIIEALSHIIFNEPFERNLAPIGNG